MDLSCPHGSAPIRVPAFRAVSNPSPRFRCDRCGGSAKVREWQKALFCLVVPGVALAGTLMTAASRGHSITALGALWIVAFAALAVAMFRPVWSLKPG